MLAEHIQRIEDAYDSVQALQDVITAQGEGDILQTALEALASVLEAFTSKQNSPCNVPSVCYHVYMTNTAREGTTHRSLK